MFSRFSCLRCVLTNASKFVTTRKSFPVSNLLLHTTNVNWNFVTPKVPLTPPTRPKVAVVIGPCGDYDGTSPVEVISLCTHMYKGGIVSPEFYAPNYHFRDLPTDDLMNFRYVKNEAARLVSFHPIYDLQYLRHHDYIGLAIIGGGGIIRLLSDIYDDGEWINPAFLRDLNQFLNNGKPIFCSSEANLLVAAGLHEIEIALGDQPIEDPWTGTEIAMSQFARILGATPVGGDEAWTDSRKNIVSIAGSSRKEFRTSRLFSSFAPLVRNMEKQTTRLWKRVQQEAIDYHNSSAFYDFIDDFNDDYSSDSSVLSPSNPLHPLNPLNPSNFSNSPNSSSSPNKRKDQQFQRFRHLDSYDPDE